MASVEYATDVASVEYATDVASVEYATDVVASVSQREVFHTTCCAFACRHFFIDDGLCTLQREASYHGFRQCKKELRHLVQG